jgi:hypothetical protein
MKDNFRRKVVLRKSFRRSEHDTSEDMGGEFYAIRVILSSRLDRIWPEDAKIPGSFTDAHSPELWVRFVIVSDFPRQGLELEQCLISVEESPFLTAEHQLSYHIR